MANQWFDPGPPIAERVDDLLRRVVLDLVRPLDAIGINPGLVDLPDIGRRVIAFVRPHGFEKTCAEDGRMFRNGRQQTLLVVHADIRAGEGDEEIPTDAPELEDPPKLVLLPDFALADAGDLETVERQELVRLNRMGPDEMGYVQHEAPPMARESIKDLSTNKLPY